MTYLVPKNYFQPKIVLLQYLIGLWKRERNTLFSQDRVYSQNMNPLRPYLGSLFGQEQNETVHEGTEGTNSNT